MQAIEAIRELDGESAAALSLLDEVLRISGPSWVIPNEAESVRTVFHDVRHRLNETRIS